MESRFVVGVLVSPLILAGCGTFPYSRGQAPPQAPAAPIEAVSPPPGSAHVWVPGAYTWQPANRASVWVPEHRTIPPKGYHWVPGHRQTQASGNVWVDGARRVT